MIKVALTVIHSPDHAASVTMISTPSSHWQDPAICLEIHGRERSPSVEGQVDCGILGTFSGLHPIG
jgi:hypothetical protein